jgi:hypothetical protein
LASRSISAVTMEISIVVSQKTKNRNTIWPNPGYIPEGSKLAYDRNTCTHVIIALLTITKYGISLVAPNNRWMHKENVVCLYRGV